MINCNKCSGLMTYTEIYTESIRPIKALKCMNCGKYEYMQPELRVIPVEMDRSRNSKFGTERTCLRNGCGKVFIGFRKKFCSQRCKDLVSIEKLREKRILRDAERGN